MVLVSLFVIGCQSAVTLSVIGCQSMSHDAGGRLHLTSLEYAGDSTLYVGTSGGQVSAWDTRQNTCFMHWLADADSTREIGVVTFTVFCDGREPG